MGWSVEQVRERVDDLQRRTPLIGFPLAVVKKYGDDKGSNLSALITYYTFFSLFPLLMVAFTILGFVLEGNPELQERIADTISERLPLPGVSADTITGNGLALVIGLALALWSGLGATQVAQDALNTVWDVARSKHPGFLRKRLQGLLVLAVIGVGIVAATAASSVAAIFGSWAAPAGIVGAFVINAAMMAMLTRVMVERRIEFGDLKWAAVVGGIGWTALQSIGGWYTARLVSNADKTYGTFAVVIGLLSWIFLQVQVFLYASEVASVSSRRLWPRSIDVARPTEADEAVANAIIARSTLIRPGHDPVGSQVQPSEASSSSTP